MIAAASSAEAAEYAVTPSSNEIAKQIPFLTDLKIRRAESMTPAHYCPCPEISQRREFSGFGKETLQDINNFSYNTLSTALKQQAMISSNLCWYSRMIVTAIFMASSLG